MANIDLDFLQICADIPYNFQSMSIYAAKMCFKASRKPFLKTKKHKKEKKWLLLLTLLHILVIQPLQTTADSPSHFLPWFTRPPDEKGDFVENIIRSSIYDSFERFGTKSTADQTKKMVHMLRTGPAEKDVKEYGGISTKDFLKIAQTMWEKNKEEFKQQHYIDHFDIIVESTESTQNSMFTSYVPHIMDKIRRDQKITSEELLKSFSIPMKEYGKHAGKSKAKLYLTDDEEYVLKTVSVKESEMLSKMAAKYRNHIKEKSLLTVFVGSFRYSNQKEDIRLVVMKNLAPRISAPYKKYDLKGIVVSKFGPKSPRFEQKNDVGLTYMEENFIQDYPRGLVMTDSSSRNILDMMKKDIEFLRDHDIVDYSLLLIIRPEAKCRPKDIDIHPHNLFLAHANQKEYFNVTALKELRRDIEVRFAIIDILVYYDLVKEWEKNLKYISSFISGKDPNNVTIQKPADYAKRFLAFFNDHILPFYNLSSSVTEKYTKKQLSLGRTSSEADHFDFNKIISEITKTTAHSSKPQFPKRRPHLTTSLFLRSGRNRHVTSLFSPASTTQGVVTN